MSRHPVSGTCRDTATGQVRGSSTVSVYLAGGTTPASIYVASTGGTAVNSVTSDTLGKFSFYVDEADYTLSQLFKIVTSKTGYDDVTYDNLPFFSFQCIDTDGTLAGNSDKKIPSQKAVKTYADLRLDLRLAKASNLSDVANAATALSNLGGVAKSLFDANSILSADTDDTPVALTVAEQRLVGRITGGVIDALTSSEVLSILLASTTGGDIPYFSDTNILARLAKGAANTHLYMNSGATAPEWASGFAVCSYTRDMTVASGTVSYTGAGFKPAVAIILSTIDGGYTVNSISVGIHGTSGGIGRIFNGNTYVSWAGASSVYIQTSETALQYAGAPSMTADGMDLAWTKGGSPSATITFKVLYIR